MKTKKAEKKKHQSPGPKKPDKRGIQVKGQWKAVELDPSLFSDEAMGGLVCFEELTDYRLVDSDKAAVKALKELKRDQKKAKKRKASEEEENKGDNMEKNNKGDDMAGISTKPAKKKRKKKTVPGEEPAEIMGTAGDDLLQEEEVGMDEGAEACPEQEGEESQSEITQQTNKKKKRKKKKNKAGGSTSTESGNTTVNDEEAKDEGLERDQSLDTEQSEVEVPSGESKSKDSAISSEQDEVSPSLKKKKNRKRRKNKTSERSEQVPDSASQGEQGAQTKDEAPPGDNPSQGKVTKAPKKKAKNWTETALSCPADRSSDVSAWKDLFVPAPVLKALSSLGFSSPTPIQALALPPAIRDRMDIVGAAETGSGKTLAFGIPMIHMILEWKEGPEKSDVAEDQHGATAKVKSLFLPDEAADTDAETNASIENNVDTEEKPNQLATDGQDSTVDKTAAPTTDRDEDAEMGSEQEEDESDAGEADDADENSDDNDIDDENLIEDTGSKKLGCVKVVDNVEFDFDTPAEASAGAADHQNLPLLGLVLTPTRELAVQVKHHIDAVAKFTDIKTSIVVGGMSQQKQSRMLNRRPEIIIATPGRLWEMIKEQHPHLQNLRQLRCLVIDEADRMVERGHFAELESLLEMLSTTQFNPKRLTFVFSATLTMVHSLPNRVLQKKKRVDQRNKLEVLMEKVGIKSKPKVIDLTRKEATVETLTETRIHCDKDEKDFFLYYFLLQYPGRTMVFANSIDCIKRLNCLLTILDSTPLPLHANMHQKQRLKNLERFAERESCVLLTTDVAARGLDIPNVQHVIHYQVPRTSETYVHRSGRTARATKEGLSLLLIGPDDMMNFKKIYRTLGKDEDLPMFPVQTKCMASIKERVNLARKIEKIEFHNSKEKHHNSWLRQAAEALEVELDEDLLLGQGRDEEDDRQQQRMVKGMKKHLNHLLSQPVFKHEIKTKYPTQMGRLCLPQTPRADVETAITSVLTQRKFTNKR